MFNCVSLCRNLKHYNIIFHTRNISTSTKCFNTHSETSSISEKGSFAKSFEKQTQLLQEPEQKQTFASLLRNSKLIDVSFSVKNSYFAT